MYRANHKETDQTARICRMVCEYAVSIQQNQVFTDRAPSHRLHDTSSKTISSNAISSKGPFRRMTISSKRHFA